ncbi:restriction endonuclease subunit S [Pseudoalteromonas sp. SR43-5]|uniref:restriction endonuclease subunit S n=1 Tax=Pseudoalteromonas sp. SR43-5 TaxID=2760941 RepID=UPI0015FC67F3|nr:restriction endonuclease subunit S [Pseudoalteromonas sp. SR43-5]MBB1304163.1 restriction endonuclease subunit S [Pseudoalteromonas sp. SR43-5]
MVPSGWETKSLDSVTKVIDCKHRTPKYVNEGVPLVSPGTIKWGALDLITPTKRVSTEEYSSLMDHCTVNVGDLVLSRNQSVGVAAFVESDEPFVLGQDTVLVKPTEADSRFLFYNLQSVETQKTIFKLAGGSTFSRINLGDIRKLKAIYPPLLEQRKIAQILSTWDKAISTTERLIDNSKQQKKALMQQLLTGKKRLLDDSGKPFEGEWEEITLEKLAKYRRGSFPQPYGNPEWVDEVNGYPFIQVYDIDKNMKLKSDTKIKISDAAIGKSVFIPKETVIVSLQGSIGRVAITQYDAYVDRTVLLFQEFIVPMDKVFFAFIMQELFEIEKTKAPGGTIKTITKEVLSNFKVHIPSITEQQKIASVLINADKEIELLQQQLIDLKQEKKALMQQLLTGKRRIKI